MGLRSGIKAALKGLLHREGASSAKATSVPERAAPASAPPPPSDSWIPLGPSSRVSEGVAGTFAVGRSEQVVAVFRHEGKLYAMDNACAHEDGPIGEGTVRGKKVACPYHDWEYDFTTGACLNDPERRQTCWAIREEGGTLLLGPVIRAGTAARGGEHNDGLEVIKQ